MERIPRWEMLLDMLAAEPDDVFLNYALAMELISREDFNKAKEQLEKVLRLKSDHLPCYYQLGKVNEGLGDVQEALSWYKKGLELAQQQHNKKAAGELNEAIWMLEDE